MNLMKTARFSLTDSTTKGLTAVIINADSKSDAQEAIKVARAWMKAAGRKSKLVFFHETTSEYSNLVKYYRARIVFQDAA
jgi:hypothetical protein